MTIEERARDFLSVRESLLLATISSDGIPTASLAPFVRKGTDLYIYTSGLSRHTQDMKSSPKVSALVVEDELLSKNLFARQRITFSCVTEILTRGGEEWQEIMTLFDQAFKETFEPIKPLRDFVLFRLVPFEVVYVEGFGRAYRMTKELAEPTHLRGTGPGAQAHLVDKSTEAK